MVTDWFAIFLVTRGFNARRHAVRILGAVHAADAATSSAADCRAPSSRVAGRWAARARTLWWAQRRRPESSRRRRSWTASRRSSPARAGDVSATRRRRRWPWRCGGSVSAARCGLGERMAGTGSGLGTILSTFLIGVVADFASRSPILVVAQRRSPSAPRCSCCCWCGHPPGARRRSSCDLSWRERDPDRRADNGRLRDEHASPSKTAPSKTGAACASGRTPWSCRPTQKVRRT